MKTSSFCACVLTRLKVLWPLHDTLSPWRHGTTTNGLHPFTITKMRPPQSRSEKIFRPARNIASNYGHATKGLQYTDVLRYNNGVISLRTILSLTAVIYARSPSAVELRSMPYLPTAGQSSISPILGLRALLNSSVCLNLWNSHVMISSFCNHHATFVTILRHHAISSKLSPRSKNANTKTR